MELLLFFFTIFQDLELTNISLDRGGDRCKAGRSTGSHWKINQLLCFYLCRRRSDWRMSQFPCLSFVLVFVFVGNDSTSTAASAKASLYSLLHCFSLVVDVIKSSLQAFLDLAASAPSSSLLGGLCLQTSRDFVSKTLSSCLCKRVHCPLL